MKAGISSVLLAVNAVSSLSKAMQFFNGSHAFFDHAPILGKTLKVQIDRYNKSEKPKASKQTSELKQENNNYLLYRKRLSLDVKLDFYIVTVQFMRE